VAYELAEFRLEFFCRVCSEQVAPDMVCISSNLLNWLSIATDTLETGAFYFTDPASAVSPQRFYRARAQ